MIPLNTDSLLQFLKGKGLPAEIQKETHQVYFLFKFNDKEFPLFFRIYEGGTLLQLLAFVPTSAKKTSLSELARLLHYINKELDIPGFGLDENGGLVFFRVMIPIVRQEVDTVILETYLNSIQTITQSFAPVIATVGAGMSTFENVLKIIKEHSKGK